ncbi:porin [Snodgrassella alvi]|uniref:porin n=1 Tax=Snodgrassella alvi TaxID=1196083 RepID=UPI003CFD0037
MKKTLIALALTTLPVAAMAEVVLYGQMKAGYEASSTKNTDEKRGPYENGIADYGSRIGFKGSEDIGHNMKVIWQVESRIHLGHSNGGSDGWANRDSFIGLETPYGKIRAGRISNQINANMDDIDTWEYNNAALGLSKFTRTDARYVGIAYDSPEWAGFNFNVLYSPRDNVNGADRQAEYKSHLGTGEKYSVGLNYKNSGWFAKYGFDYLKNSGFKVHHVENGAYVGENKDGQVHRLEGGYDANNWFVGAGYQYTKNTSSYFRALNDTQFGDVNDHDMGVDNQGQEAALTVGYHFGNIFPKISYAHGWDAKINGTKERNTKYDQIVIGADYAFSKRTTANVQAGWLREGNGYSGNLYDPAHNDVAQKSNGKTKTTAIGVGLKHVF